MTKLLIEIHEKKSKCPANSRIQNRTSTSLNTLLKNSNRYSGCGDGDVLDGKEKEDKLPNF